MAIFSFLLTGFGYQPFWLFLFVFTLGFIVVFPTVYSDYWIIEKDSVVIQNFYKKNLSKIAQLIRNQHNYIYIHYSDIVSAEIVYKPIFRTSPFDFRFDAFYIKIITSKKAYILNFDSSVKNYLPQFVSFLRRKGIQVIDEDKIVELLISGTSLYDHFHTS